MCSAHSCTSPEGRSPMRVWKEVRRPSMHMVDNVGISFLNTFQIMLVCVLVGYWISSVSLCHHCCQQAAQIEMGGRGEGKKATYSAKAVYILRCSAWAVGIICPLPNFGYRCFSFFPLAPRTSPSAFFSLSMNLYVISL